MAELSSERKITVLVVDDDPDIRIMETLLLQFSGRIEVVAEAVDGLDALATFRRMNTPPIPDVVVLDNRMPGMTGLEVASLLLDEDPAQRIILFSAYLNDAIITEARDLGITRIVSKNNVQDLADIVLQVHNSNA